MNNTTENWLLISSNEINDMYKEIKFLKKNQEEILRKIDLLLNNIEKNKKDINIDNKKIIEFLSDNRKIYIEKLNNGENKLNDMSKYFRTSYLNQYHNLLVKSKKLNTTGIN
mgnify:CR=1 FL=1